MPRDATDVSSTYFPSLTQIAGLLTALAVVLASCGGAADSGSQSSVPDPGGVELACEEPVGIERALGPEVRGHATRVEAADAWRSETADIPQGTWQEQSSDTMVLMSEEGERAGRASVTGITGNSITTFPEERFVSTSITYCQDDS